jgi:hypothetical protein
MTTTSIAEILNFVIHREIILPEGHLWVLITNGVTLHGQEFSNIVKFHTIEEVFVEIQRQREA